MLGTVDGGGEGGPVDGVGTVAVLGGDEAVSVAGDAAGDEVVVGGRGAEADPGPPAARHEEVVLLHEERLDAAVVARGGRGLAGEDGGEEGGEGAFPARAVAADADEEGRGGHDGMMARLRICGEEEDGR